MLGFTLSHPFARKKAKGWGTEMVQKQAVRDLVDRPLRKVVALRLQILAQHVPQGLGLLRAEEDGLVVANRYLVGAGAQGQAEDKLEVPNAHAHLHAIGIGLAVVG